MSSKRNCFSIVGAEVQAGIPSNTPWGSLPAKFTGSHNQRVQTCPKLPGQPDRCWFVYFAVPELNFETGPYLPGLNIWPGGEWHTRRPAWLGCDESIDPRKRRQAPDRGELWALPRTETRLLLTDQAGGIRLLQRREGRFELSKVSPTFLGDYLCNRAEELETHRGVFWVERNLTLLARGFPEINLRGSLAVVRRRLAEIQRISRVESR